MKKRRDWIVVGIVAAVLAVAVVLAGTVVPGAAGRAVALGTTPSPWPSPSAGVVLQVGHDGTFKKQYTLADLQALGQGPFNGFAGFMNSGNIVYGPEAVSGIRVTDIVQDALQTQLTTAQSVAFIGSDGYSQTYSDAQLTHIDQMTQLYDASYKPPKAVSSTSYAGAFVPVLVYSDPAGNVFDPDPAPNGDGPLRLMVGDTLDEPVVMTGSDSVKWLVKINVVDSVAKNWSLKLTGLKIKGKRQARTLTRNDFQSCVNCHGSSYTLSGHKYSGTPLYLLVGEVDGGATMDYNAALAKKGYRIEIVSTSGKTRIVSSRTIIDKRNIVLAWQRDGALLGSSAFPLRLVGAKLRASQELGRIKSVVLLPPAKK